MLQTYERNPYLFTGGKGVYLHDEFGAEYLDLLSGIGCSALGYGHPALEAAIIDQTKKLLHTSNLFFHEHTAELALRLTEISGLDRVFLCNSGTEAWEAAMKLARAHALMLREEGRTIGTKFIALEHSFHGRSMGSVSTTHKEKYREPFAPLIPTVDFVAFNDVAALRAAFSPRSAPSSSRPSRAKAASIPSRRSSSPPLASFATPPARSSLPMRSSAASAVLASGSPISTMASCPMSRRSPSPSPAAFPWARCFALKRPQEHSIPECTGRHSAAIHLPALPLSPSSTPSSATALLEHVTETGTYFIDQFNTLAKSPRSASRKSAASA